MLKINVIMKRFKRHKDYGFFDQDIRLSKLSQLGDPLDKLNKGIDFERFRNILESNLTKLSKGKGGRPPYDYVLMFKIVILQRYYNLSDEQVEYQINDRMSFMRFLDLTIADDIPDSRTVWSFREQLTDLELIEPLFDLFLKELETLGLVVNEGKIIDASFVEVPRQRNSRDDNKKIKNNEIPEDWKDKHRKLSQKDREARWTKKNNQTFFGYKNHIKTDSKSKIICKYKVTTAEVHDSQATENLLDNKDKGEELYADSAYTGEKQEEVISEKELINRVHEKAYKNKPLTEKQKESNKIKSKTRVRVEHIFGFMENSMNGMEIRSIGFKRAEAVIGLSNLVYNMFRKIQLQTIPAMG
jgi:IS5 family transposase